MAGLIWEKWCDKAITDCGFEKIPSWECLYVNPVKQLFLSVYVDDFKMAGNAENLPLMWQELGKCIDLEPSVPLDGNVYLGCGQSDVVTDEALVSEKETLIHNLMNNEKKDAQRELCPDDFKPEISTQPTESRGQTHVRPNSDRKISSRASVKKPTAKDVKLIHNTKHEISSDNRKILR